MLIQFGINSYRFANRQLSAQRCYNMYSERQAKDAKTPILVKGAPGIVALGTCGVGPVRGMHEMNDVLYIVSGNYLYSMTDTGAVTTVGGQISGSGIVAMDDNGRELAIANGTNGYVWDDLSGFRVINSANFHPAFTNTHIDGFMAWERSGTNEFFISDSLNAYSYSDYYASAESKSDNVMALLNHVQLLYVFGKRTTEFWSNEGAANFPFRRLPGGVAARGIISPYAVGVEDSTVHIVGDDRLAYRFAGTKLEKISTFPIDEHWQAATRLDDANLFGYTFEGHKFIVYNFPTLNETWVWDISSGLWHERGSRDMYNNDLGRWRGNCSTPAYGKVMIGDFYSGQVGYLDRATYTEFGNQIIGEIISPPLFGGGKFVTMPWLEVNIENAVGTDTGQGEDPQIMLAISDDGGRSWGGPEMWASMGKQGATLTQLRYGPLGGYYERAMKLVISDPVRRNVMSCFAPDMELGV